MTHQDGVARLQVSREDERESHPLLYVIACDGIRLSLRPGPGGILRALVGR